MITEYRQLVPVVFGEGAITRLGEKVKELGCKKVMCVYDQGIKAAGIAEKAENSLKAAGVDYVVFDKIMADPTDQLVNECGALAKAEGVDGFVGVGGGSSMDCAKTASLLLNHPAPIEQYFTAPPSFMEASVPVILVPTTSGTGSEVTQVCVITRSSDHSKPSIFMLSSLAIVDPELTWTAPATVTAHTGMDAFSHAAEAITANGRNPYSEVLAVGALRKITRYLPVAMKDGFNREARYHIALASNWAGIAFSNTIVHLGHVMADGISAAFHTPHGMNCSWVIPEVLRLCAQAVPDKVQIVGEAIGVSFAGGETPEEIGGAVASAVKAFVRSIGIKSPKEMGLDREQFLNCCDLASRIDLDLRLNTPVEPTKEVIRTVYERVYDGYTL